MAPPELSSQHPSALRPKTSAAVPPHIGEAASMEMATEGYRSHRRPFHRHRHIAPAAPGNPLGPVVCSTREAPSWGAWPSAHARETAATQAIGAPQHQQANPWRAQKQPPTAAYGTPNDMSLDLALGCCRPAHLLPQHVHRADCRRRSLEASPPQRMIKGASAMSLMATVTVPAPNPKPGCCLAHFGKGWSTER
jgi:hypothetical protein